MIELPKAVPPQGTPEFEQFVERAMRDPRGPEALVLDASIADAKRKYEDHLKQMLGKMQELVPGQCFRDVSLFHEKFQLAATDHPNHELPNDVLKFRIRFMLEELLEYCEAVGLTPLTTVSGRNVDNLHSTGKSFDPELALDALIDLCYVAIGTAYLHRFNFNEGWRRVQGANMAKVRAARVEDSKRGSTFDVVKPPGWTPPSHSDLIGFKCQRCGAQSRTTPRSEGCAVQLPSGSTCGGLLS